MLYTYVFVFTETEGIALASFHRYMGTYFIFWIIGISYMTLKQVAVDGFKKGLKKNIIIAISIAIVLVLVGLSDPFKLNIIGGRRTENVYEQEAIEHAQIIHDTIGYDAKVYLIFQKSRGYSFMGTRYQLATNPANLGTWSMGDPYSDEDTWTSYRTSQEFLDVLYEQDYEYVYLGYADEQFWSIYGELFDMPDSGYIIYEVTENAAAPLVAVK